MRSKLAPTPKAKAATTAGACQGSGSTLAGATIQNPVAASPDTNEQFFLQAPLSSHQGRNGFGPLKSWVWLGRGRCQWSLSPRLTMRPGPIEIVAMRKITARPLGAHLSAAP